MSRFIVERTFPAGLAVPVSSDGAKACAGIVVNNAEHGVTWVQSYVSADKTRSFCVYDAPSPEAIRQVARRNDLPVDRITAVSDLSPYFYL
ncbi:MAG: hypothetical protein JWQ90_4709 [Hydrocarboniphaga sp.]|uniref:DUF4242 domain-containing protein n=1 Tax=Hydrocarboniphaga sp. TaxID=2033016 RepID=UPI0026211D89|nr:DUF4242 domain-containing protein [Hydrocarboniphaga sp.]MDB5972259.1 hypothetical protein [Hydrocarboniphaga sp.]